MGDRGQVKIVDPHTDNAVWLYSHWGAHELDDVVRACIQRGDRLNDAEYLARIIFEKMIEGDEGGSTGFGIGTAQHGDVWRVVEVDLAEEEVRVVDRDEVTERYAFNDVASKATA